MVLPQGLNAEVAATEPPAASCQAERTEALQIVPQGRETDFLPVPGAHQKSDEESPEQGHILQYRPDKENPQTRLKVIGDADGRARRAVNPKGHGSSEARQPLAWLADHMPA